MYYVALLGFVFLGSVFCENVTVDIVKNKILNEVSDRYLSFSVNPNLFLKEGGTYVRDCLCMEKFMYPSYMRIVVPFDLEISTASKSIIPNVKDDKLRRTPSNKSEKRYTKIEQLKKLMDWVKKSEFIPFITLESGEHESWNPKTAIAVMSMAEKYGLDDCVWQLGKECRNQSSQQYIDVLKTFKLMMKVYSSEKNGEWKLSSGNFNKCVKADETEQFLTTADEFLDVITFDSQNDFEGMDFIDDSNKEIVKEHLMKNGVYLWKTIEENQNTSETHKAIDWLQALGDTANSGYSVVFKNLDENELMIPSLSYYVSLLHKKLAGRHVLEVSQSVGSAGLYIFGHCANFPNGPISGGVTLFAGNSRDEPANFNVKISSGEILQFILQEGAEKEIIINGKKKSDQGYFEPVVTEVKPFEALVISLPPKAVGFWVITNTDVEVCYFNNEDLSEKEDDQQYRMYMLNRYKRQVEENTENGEIDKNIPNTGSDIIVNDETRAVFNKRLSTPVYETLEEVSGEETHTIVENNNSEIGHNEDDFKKTAHSIDNQKPDIAVTLNDDFDSDHLRTTVEPKEIIAGRFSSINEEDIKEARNVHSFIESLKNDSNLDFEAVNKFTDNIDIDRDFVDIPIGRSLYDLDSDEMKTTDSQDMILSEMNYLEDLINLIGQLSSLMELQEEFLRVERSILQPPSPLSYSGKIANLVKNLHDDVGSELKRIPRVAESDSVSKNLDGNVDVLVVFKKVSLPPNEPLTSDRIKELFFNTNSNVRSGKVLRFVSDNETILSVDLNSVEETLRGASDFEEKPVIETITEESIKARAIEGIVYEPTTPCDSEDRSSTTPKINLPILPAIKLSENIPKINDLVNRAQNLLNNVNPKVEDNETQESQADDEIVGSPRTLLPLSSLHLSNSLEKTRLKMQEMRLRTQAKIAQLRAKHLLNPSLHKHLLIKRDIQKQEGPLQHSVHSNVTNISKNKRKKFARNNRKWLDIIKEMYKQNNNKDLTKEGNRKSKTNEINKSLSNIGSRMKRFIASEDVVDEDVLSREVDNDDSNLIIKQNKIINTGTVNRSTTAAELKAKKTAVLSKTSKDAKKLNILSTNGKMNSDDNNEIFIKPYDSKVAKVTKHFMKEKRDDGKKIANVVSLKDFSEGCHKTNVRVDPKLEDAKQAKMTKTDDSNILDTVVDRVTSFFQGIYEKVKDIYNKASGSL